jgi:hypothetical protein
MRERFISVASFLIVLSAVSNQSYACYQSPVAQFKNFRTYVIIGRSVTFDGTLSYDPDGPTGIGGGLIKGIKKFEWDFNGDGVYDYYETSSYYPDGAFDGITTHTYYSTGDCTVRLKVTDNDAAEGGTTDRSATKTCSLKVREDSDNDDMPDEWENNYGLVVGTDDAEGYKDSDGYNNLCEYLHGTNPNSSSSHPSDPPSSQEIITICVPGDVRSIQRAINASIDGDIIVVAAGTYTNEGVYEQDVYLGIDFSNAWFTGRTRAITVRSTDPNNPAVVAATIIDCQGDYYNNRRGFYFHSKEGPGSVLAGFTITNGYHDKGGGIYCLDASPTISECIISNNIADTYGGGGIHIESSNPTNYKSSPIIKNCVFSQNADTGNGGGGLCIKQSSPTSVNCVFVENYASSWGGGVYNDDSFTKLINCTFSGNSTTASSGGGLYNYEESNYQGGHPQITNCVFWGNKDVDATVDESTQIGYESGQPQVTYSCIEDGNPGDGSIPFSGVNNVNKNTDADPRFINAEDPAGPDFVFATLDDGLYLRSDVDQDIHYSPCIDKGNDTAVPGDITTDIIGNPRKADGDHQVTTPDTDNPTVDMGAYEVIPVWYVDITKAEGGNGKSWSTARKYLQDALNDTNLKAGDEIRVAKGLYKPGSTRSATFQLKIGVAVYGGFAGTDRKSVG